MTEILLLLAGALICNAIPHLAAGLRGEAFPTPFATPRGVGNSPPLVNALWGSFNLLLGGFLAWRRLVTAEFNPGLVAIAVGFLAAAVFTSLHFGRVRAGTPPT